MTLALVIVGAALLSFPALVDNTSMMRPPEEWARVTATVLLVGAIVTELGLVLTALPTVLHVPVLADLTGACHSIVDRLAVQPVLGWTSLALAAIVGFAGVAALRRCRLLAARARIEPWIGAHHMRAGYELVIVPTAADLALSVPGSAPQVVVSDGMTQRLEAGQFEAVVEHEAAHLRLQHRRYLVLSVAVAASFRWLPLVNQSVAVLRLAVEEWADETAAQAAPQRRRDLRAALAKMGAVRSHSVDGESPLDRRLFRLAGGQPLATMSRRAVTYTPAVSLVATGTMLVAIWLGMSHHLFSVGGYCPQ